MSYQCLRVATLHSPTSHTLDSTWTSSHVRRSVPLQDRIFSFRFVVIIALKDKSKIVPVLLFSLVRPKKTNICHAPIFWSAGFAVSDPFLTQQKAKHVGRSVPSCILSPNEKHDKESLCLQWCLYIWHIFVIMRSRTNALLIKDTKVNSQKPVKYEETGKYLQRT